MSKLFQYAGIAAGVVLIAFGIGAVVIGLDGRDRVATELGREQIVGTPDSTIPTSSSTPAARPRPSPRSSASTPSRPRAARPTPRCRSTSTPTARARATRPPPARTPRPCTDVNPARQIWVTETALTTALNTAYFAESMATFVAAMGGALLLVGIGFLVISLRVLRQPSTSQETDRKVSVAAKPAVGSA